MILKEQELNEIKGGGLSLTVLAAIGAFGVLVAGIIDGIIRPLKCN